MMEIFSFADVVFCFALIESQTSAFKPSERIWTDCCFCVSDGSMWEKAFLQCTDTRPRASPRARVLAAESTCRSTVTQTSCRTSPNPAAPSAWARPTFWAAAPAHPCHQWSSLSLQSCPNPALNLSLPPARPPWRSSPLLPLSVSFTCLYMMIKNDLPSQQ